MIRCSFLFFSFSPCLPACVHFSSSYLTILLLLLLLLSSHYL
jgi:hypothetical protein